jgi:hypothetical protein
VSLTGRQYRVTSYPICHPPVLAGLLYTFLINPASNDQVVRFVVREGGLIQRSSIKP